MLILQLFSLQDTICARGYWRIPKDVSKDQLCDWFEKQIQQSGFRNLKETLYFPEVSGIIYFFVSMRVMSFQILNYTFRSVN